MRRVQGRYESVLNAAVMTHVLADAADSVASFVEVFITVYILLILAYVLTSWI